MSRRYFGTDGVRGIVGEALTPDLVEQLGRAAVLASGAERVFVGRDTRASGPLLEDGARAGHRRRGRDRGASAAYFRALRSRSARSTSESRSPPRTTRPPTTA